MNRELKLTPKMSGFRSGKVTGGAQHVATVKVGKPPASRQGAERY